MNYDRNHVTRFFAGLTPDSKPCMIGICPLMAVYPSLRRMADATRADPELVRALDAKYRELHPGLPWRDFTAGEILAVIRGLT